ncbi:MAG: hypothetical protein ACKOPT_01755 [Cyanobium sp.]
MEPELTPDDYLPWSPAQLAQALQRTLLISGIGDVVYFSGVDGYRTIQRILFRTLRERVEQLVTAMTPADRFNETHLGYKVLQQIGLSGFLTRNCSVASASPWLARRKRKVKRWKWCVGGKCCCRF